MYATIVIQKYATKAEETLFEKTAETQTKTKAQGRIEKIETTIEDICVLVIDRKFALRRPQQSLYNFSASTRKILSNCARFFEIVEK